jgi:hypothetical protein
MFFDTLLYFSCYVILSVFLGSGCVVVIRMDNVNSTLYMSLFLMSPLFSAPDRRLGKVQQE